MTQADGFLCRLLTKKKSAASKAALGFYAIALYAVVKMFLTNSSSPYRHTEGSCEPKYTV